MKKRLLYSTSGFVRLLQNEGGNLLFDCLWVAVCNRDRYLFDYF